MDRDHIPRLDDAPEVSLLLPETPQTATESPTVESVSDALRDWAGDILAKNVADPAQQKEIQELLEAVRKAAYAEGYAAARMEMAFSGSAPATPLAKETKAASEEGEAEGHEYISRTPFKTTRAIVLEYIKSIAPRAAGPTEVIRNTQAKTGVAISYASVRRAFDDLARSRLVVEEDRSRWRLK